MNELNLDDGRVIWHNELPVTPLIDSDIRFARKPELAKMLRCHDDNIKSDVTTSEVLEEMKRKYGIE